MSDTFDPYHQWLRIAPEEQPPNHYRLLGLDLFEADAAKIEQAVARRMGSLQEHLTGEHAEAALRILNEISTAKACLLAVEEKAAYDAGLRGDAPAESTGDENAATDDPAKKAAAKVERERCERFLKSLEEKDLVSSKLIANLRRQIEKSDKVVKASSVAKRLIKAGHLTQPLAKRLLAKAKSSKSKPTETKPKKTKPTETKPAAAPPPAAPAEDSEIHLAPLDDEPQAESKKKKKAAKKPAPTPAPADDDMLDLIPLDDEPTTGAEAAKKKMSKPAEPAKPVPEAVPAIPEPDPVAAVPVASTAPLEDEFSAMPANDAGAAGAAGAGPLDGLTTASTASAGEDASSLSAPKKKGIKGLFGGGQKKVGRKENVWDSPLLLVGGGALLGILILGGVLIWALTRQSGDEAFGQAKDEYDAANYSQAIHKYTQYLEKFPTHASASIARVHLGLAQLRQKTGRGTRDWTVSLQEAKKVLGRIAPETEFKQAHADLSAMLPDIAQGLADQAQREPKPETVAQAEEALAMVTKYVPKSLQRPKHLADIRASLALSNRRINRGEELGRAIAAMQEAVAAGTPDKAYDLRKALLKQYPDVAEDASMVQAVLEVSLAQQAAVARVDQAQAAETAEPASTVLSAVPIVQQDLKRAVPNVAGRVVLANASGAVHAVDASNGAVLWRRFLGFGSNRQGTDFFPIPVSERPGADTLLVAPATNELLRVESATGRLVWRHPIGERFDAAPVLVGNLVFVATRGGRLVSIDVASGQSAGYIQIPQPLAVPPVVDSDRGLVFQIAEHSNLYVLGLDDGACRKVYHLGHEPGAITAPPIIAGPFLMITVNDRLNDSLFRVLSLEEAAGDEKPEEKAGDAPIEQASAAPKQAGPPLDVIQQMRLEGHVDVAPSIAGRMLLITTDIGTLYVYEFSGKADAKPLTHVAKRSVSGGEQRIRFSWMQPGYFLLGDHQLTRYDIQSSRSQLAEKWIVAEGSIFDQPPTVIHNTTFYVRRKSGVPGVMIAAADMAQGERYWETRLTSRPVVEPTVDAAKKQVTVVTSSAGVYQVDPTTAGAKPPVVALDSDRLTHPVEHVVAVGDDLLAMNTGGNARQLMIFDANQTPQRLRLLPLPDPAGCSPLMYGGGLLVPTTVGQVFLLDPRTGQKMAEPFQPPLDNGNPPQWRLPALTDDGKVLLSDGRTTIYSLEIVGQPTRRLNASQKADTAAPIVSPVATCGNAAYAVDATGAVHAFRLPQLTEIESPVGPGGRPVWGPGRVGSHVMLATDDNRLTCFDGEGKLVFQTEMAHGALAGRPLAVEGGFVAASIDGVVWRIDAKTGEELGKVDVGRPLGCGPVRLGTRLLLVGVDGTLYQIQLP